MRHPTRKGLRTAFAGQGNRRLGTHCLSLIVLCCLFTPTWASTISGRVMNRSTDQPSYGDEVILYRVDRTMHEQARVISDQQGNFRFTTKDQVRYLIAVQHGNVIYHMSIMSGTLQLEVPVYDAVAKLEEVREDSDTLFFEAGSSRLNVTEFFVLSNTSIPARTLAGSNTFQFAVPAEATLNTVAVQPPDTLPSETKFWPYGKTGQYRIAYPIHPGVTKVRVKYSLPYPGSASFQPQVLRPVAAMALMVPESIQLTVDRPDIFVQSVKDNGLSVYIAKNLQPGRLSRLWLSAAGKFDNGSESEEGTPDASNFEASLPDFPPGTSSKQGVFADTTRTFLCFETPIVVIAVVIAIAMLRNRGELSARTGDQPNRVQTTSHGEDRL